MTTSTAILAPALAIALAAGLAAAQPPVQPAAQPPRPPEPAVQPAPSDTTITIYSSALPGAIPADAYRPVPPSMGANRGYNPWQGQPIPGYAVVKAERTIPLRQGRQELRFTDVAALLDPTTVAFESLTAPATTRVIEQSYQFDLVSPQKLLDRYIGKPIQIDGVTGVLMSAGAGSAVLQLPDGTVRMFGDTSKNAVFFPALPDGLITKPTLIWDLAAQQAGEHRARVSYQTEGVTWWADYNLILEETPGNTAAATLDLAAWVSILNQSGATYDNARLKLVAGDVHRAPKPPQTYPQFARRAEMADAAGAPGFEQKAFFEYHLYTLGRPTTIPENSTKQIELFPPARNIPAQRVLVYNGVGDSIWLGDTPMTDQNFGIQSNKKVDTYIRFANARDQGLGVPLPAGRVRVSKLDPADKSLEFIGEDVLSHTPQGETVLLKMGTAFDVVGERTQTDFALDMSRRRIEETIQIKVRNRKAEPVTVLVKESLHRWVNWEIAQKSHDFEKIDSRTVHFPVRIDPDKEAVVTYKVRYTW